MFIEIRNKNIAKHWLVTFCLLSILLTNCQKSSEVGFEFEIKETTIAKIHQAFLDGTLTSVELTQTCVGVISAMLAGLENVPGDDLSGITGTAAQREKKRADNERPYASDHF